MAAVLFIGSPDRKRLAMVILIIIAVLVIFACIFLMVALTVWRDKIRLWTGQLLVRFNAMPDTANPKNPANEIYANDLAFNVRIVLYFMAAFGIIIMLVVIAAIAGIGFLGYFL